MIRVVKQQFGTFFKKKGTPLTSSASVNVLEDLAGQQKWKIAELIYFFKSKATFVKR